MKIAKDVQSTELKQKTDIDAVEDVLVPAGKFAAATGGLGFLYGGTVGILRGTTPVLAGIASSAQCTAIGAAFSVSRTLLLEALDDTESKPRTFTIASTLAGAFSGGSAGYLFRGPRNVIPGIICWSALGAGGQAIANAWTRPRIVDPERKGFLERLSHSSWSPVKSMTNAEYADLLRERALKLEVEIAILDDKIAALKDEQAAVPAPVEDETSK